MPYEPRHHVRIVTATSLFDGHDAAINIMRRILQSTGAEIIHLGHDRSAADIASAAIEEDAQAVAITSYQGGHMEFFGYVRRLLDEAGAPHVKIFGGGGGTILPDEAAELERTGIERIYTPDDGRKLGLQGMIDDLLARADFSVAEIGAPAVQRTIEGAPSPAVPATRWSVDTGCSKNSACLGSLISRPACCPAEKCSGWPSPGP